MEEVAAESTINNVVGVACDKERFIKTFRIGRQVVGCDVKGLLHGL